jgi:hypothetical protein
MDEEIDQIEKNQTLELVPRPKDKNMVGTKWIFKKPDPGGYRWPPKFFDWLKTVFWQFWQFTIFSSF